jgi:phosphoenolpyruvate-protein kinase (PTS system EI component)
LRDGGRKADEQRAAADAVTFMILDCGLRIFSVSQSAIINQKSTIHRHAEVEAEFQEQLEEDVLLRSVRVSASFIPRR